jgi:hypothetical protein
MRVSSPLFRKQLLSAQRFSAKKGRVWAIQLFPSVRQRARGHALFAPCTETRRELLNLLSSIRIVKTAAERERTIRPNGLQNKSKWKTQHDKFPKFDWERARKLAFLHTPNRENKTRNAAGAGGRVDATSPVQLSHLSIARALGKHILICLRMASRSKFIEPRAE